MKNPSFKSGEICCLCISLTAFRIFTSLPHVFTWISGPGAPLSALLSGVSAIVFVLLLYKGQNILSRTKKPLIKYILSILALIYLSVSAFYTLNEFSRFSKATAFPATPLWFISLFFIIASGIGALRGISPLLRICRYFIPVFVTVVALLLGSVLWECDLNNLFPVLGTGSGNTLSKGLSGILLYSDILLIFLTGQPSGNGHKIRRSALWGCIIGVLVCFFTVLTFTAKIPYPLSKDGQFPFYLLMKEVYYGRFFQRVDAVVLLLSALWGMFSLCLHLSLITNILTDTFEITSKPVIVFPLSAALFLLSIRGMDNIFSALLYTAAAFAAMVIIFALFKKEDLQNEK